MILKKIFLSLIFILNIEVLSKSLDPIQLLSDFVAVDTINPPGNESRAVEFYAKIFEEEGIEYLTGESAPGRGNIWARIKGGDQPALILLQHTDVVPASKDYWETDPMIAEIKDGYLYGRGVIDMKGAGISHLISFIRLHREKKKLNRDLIFCQQKPANNGIPEVCVSVKRDLFIWQKIPITLQTRPTNVLA